MRYVILNDLTDLADVAAFWPFASIEKVALWTYAAEDQSKAERFAWERFPERALVVLPLAEAESIVRQHIAAKQRREAHRVSRRTV
jgi:hypothetical protein